MAEFLNSIPTLLFLIILPAFTSVILIVIPSRFAKAIRCVSLGCSSFVSMLTVVLFFSFDQSVTGVQFSDRYEWLSIPGPWGSGEGAISLILGVDGVGVTMVLLTGIVMLAGTLISWNISKFQKDFFVLYFLLLSGVFGVFVSYDLFFFFFFYELSVLPMYLLISKWGSDSKFPTFVRSSEYSALKLTLVLVGASVLIWVSIVAIFVQAELGSFDINQIQENGIGQLSVQFQNIFFLCLMLGFGVLAGMWPFHTWSPDGHVAAPTAVSMVHAGVLMKLGAFGILRVAVTLMPEGAETWMPLLFAFGLVNVIYGAFSAMGQTDLKYVIGYSSVSHMGYVLMGIATLNVLGMSGAVLQMFSHGVMTALFFAVVGMIYERTHTRDTLVLNGLTKKMTIIAIFFAMAGLTSLGLPGLSGFPAELLIFIGVFKSYEIWGVIGGSLAIVGVGITAVYILRLLSRVFMGPLPEKWDDQTDANVRERLVASVLSIVILVIGLWPFHFFKVIEVGISPLLERLA